MARVVAGLVLAGFCWLSFSVGQALTAPDGGSISARLAEWARDHYLGPVVTFGEWLTYQPPKVGGKPPFSLAVPSAKPTVAHHRGFTAYVPGPVAPFAHPPLPGEGVWRLAEAVHGEPAVYVTFLRVDSVHTSYVAGIASFDQRLVNFQLRPGSQDPGSGFGGGESWIPPGQRAGLLATFNGGFRLNASAGGFYLNGRSSGALVNGAASEVYYRNGTITIGQVPVRPASRPAVVSSPPGARSAPTDWPSTTAASTAPKPRPARAAHPSTTPGRGAGADR